MQTWLRFDHVSRAESAALLLAVALLGCSESGHEVLVDLRSDFVPGVEVTGARTTLDDPMTRRDHVLTVTDDLAGGLRVAELDDVPVGERRLTVTLLGVGGVAIASRVVRLEVDGDQGITVVIARDCAAVVCPEGRTCAGGSCVAETCLEEEDPTCGANECAADTECAAPPASCARASCELGTCFDIATPTACGADQYCDVATGCVPLPIAPMDAGIDAAPADTGADTPSDVPDAEADAGADASLGCRVDGSLICERFEDPALPGWEVVTSDGEVTASAIRAAEGTRSGRFRSLVRDGTAFIENPDILGGLSGGALWISAQYFLPGPVSESIGVLSIDDADGTMAVIAAGFNSGDNFRYSANNEDFFDVSDVLPLDRWFCVEVRVELVDGGSAEFFVDGSSIGSALGVDPFPTGGWDRVRAGITFAFPGTPENELFIDDLIVSRTRPGCP